MVSEEVYEILQLAQAGSPLDARRLFPAMVETFYRYPRHVSMQGTGREAQYEDVSTAFAACERHVAEAVRVTARIRDGAGGDAGVDIMQVSDGYRRMVELAIRKLGSEAKSANARDFATLLAATGVVLKDASAFFGKPLQHNVTVSGKITHDGLTSSVADAYSAWHGGTADLAGVVADAEFVEIPT